MVGLDLSLGQLRTGGVSGVAQADMRHLPLRTGSADAFWCQAALLHIPHGAVPSALGEPGGSQLGLPGLARAARDAYVSESFRKSLTLFDFRGNTPSTGVDGIIGRTTTAGRAGVT